MIYEKIKLLNSSEAEKDIMPRRKGLLKLEGTDRMLDLPLKS